MTQYILCSYNTKKILQESRLICACTIVHMHSFLLICDMSYPLQGPVNLPHLFANTAVNFRENIFRRKSVKCIMIQNLFREDEQRCLGRFLSLKDLQRKSSLYVGLRPSGNSLPSYSVSFSFFMAMHSHS
jgi:hypothetical protein